MKVVFIGAGNLATQLALSLYNKAYNITQIYSRTTESATTLARLVNAEYTTHIEQITSDADIYIFSVKDSVLEELISNINKNNGIWLHTAGSIPLSIFEGKVDNFGVFYPFQTFSKERNINFSEVPIFFEANNAENEQKLEEIASSISNKTFKLDSDRRKYLHLTGVFACNFVNHLYYISENILKVQGIPFSAIVPLIEETASKVKSVNPYHAQTGPAIRMDMNVIDKHLALLTEDRMKEIYEIMSQSIFETYNKH